jgi:hypothetical protein
MPTKNVFLYPFEGKLINLHYPLKIKGHKEVRTVQIKVFLRILFLLDDGRIRIREVQKHMGPNTYGSGSTILA